jgi:type III restriction enzyme
MNKYVYNISNRLSLREPQRKSLEILSDITDLISIKEKNDLEETLNCLQQKFPNVKGFDREFPSLCFSLATGVGKTRLMGAFITYLYSAHHIKNFFVLAPNLTIYNKLISDFTPNTPKYVFKGIADFAVIPPVIITGENYGWSARNLYTNKDACNISIFNISKINSEVRGGKSPKFKRISEYLGQSYFDHLSQIGDLVIIMDESHRYRASAGIKAINDLKPIMGLELTATPFTEAGKKHTFFQNIVYDYALGQAIKDGFVKVPAVVTRENFNPQHMTQQEIERLKLEDGIALHEQTKAKLKTYSHVSRKDFVKPFVLVIARDISHAKHLFEVIESDTFFNGNYKGKVIQVDSSQSGEKEDEMVERLLAVESKEEPTEIVIHVNMLKEGWDVTNLYTIIPLRAANARTLVEQSVGRGLRLPYGKRTGDRDLDRLSIIAHDRFQEIVDDSKKEDSPIQLEQVVLTNEQLREKIETVSATLRVNQVLMKESDIKNAHRTMDIIYEFGVTNDSVQRLEDYKNPKIFKDLVAEINQDSGQTLEPNNVQKILGSLVANTIQIPRIAIRPKENKCGFKTFLLNIDNMRYQPPTDEALHVQNLHDGESSSVVFNAPQHNEKELEDYIISPLIDFDDISYEENSILINNLAQQVINHFRSYLPEKDILKVVRYYAREIAQSIREQMGHHYWEENSEFETVEVSGFTKIKEPRFNYVNGKRLDFRNTSFDKEKISSYIFFGFERCIFDIQKFDSNPERILAIILDRDSLKWFKPARDQFDIYYKHSEIQKKYEPDFIAEMKDCICMIEVKANNEMNDEIVLVKKEAAWSWCENASKFAEKTGSKPWLYIIIPHDDLRDNMTLGGLVKKYITAPIC